MAEIEHYVDPDNKNHPGYNDVKDTVMRFLPKDVQLQGKTELKEMTVGEAVEKVYIQHMDRVNSIIDIVYFFYIRVLLITKLSVTSLLVSINS